MQGALASQQPPLGHTIPLDTANHKSHLPLAIRASGIRVQGLWVVRPGGRRAAKRSPETTPCVSYLLTSRLLSGVNYALNAKVTVSLGKVFTLDKSA